MPKEKPSAWSAYRKYLRSLDLSGGAQAVAATSTAAGSSLAESLENFLQSWMPQQNSKTGEEPVLSSETSMGKKGKGKTRAKGSSSEIFKGSGKASNKGTKGFSASAQKGAGQAPRAVLTSVSSSSTNLSEAEPGNSDASLAKQLVNVLKICLNHAKSDHEVADTILNRLAQNKPKPNTQHVQQAAARSKGKGTKKPSITGDQRISGFRNSEWSRAPNITQLKVLESNFRQGSFKSFNMVEIPSIEDFHSLITLWNAFSKPAPLTALLTGPAVEVLGATLTQKTLFRGKAGAKVETVAILALGDQTACPWTVARQEVPREKVPTVSKCTIRILDRRKDSF